MKAESDGHVECDRALENPCECARLPRPFSPAPPAYHCLLPSLSTESPPIFSEFFLAIPGLSCDLRDLVPWLRIKPGPPALGVWSLSHWTTREIPIFCASEEGPTRSQRQRARAWAATTLCSGPTQDRCPHVSCTWPVLRILCGPRSGVDMEDHSVSLPGRVSMTPGLPWVRLGPEVFLFLRRPRGKGAHKGGQVSRVWMCVQGCVLAREGGVTSLPSSL